jgi:hypothetical protein
MSANLELRYPPLAWSLILLGLLRCGRQVFEFIGVKYQSIDFRALRRKLRAGKINFIQVKGALNGAPFSVSRIANLKGQMSHESWNSICNRMMTMR